jgi:antitoxin (DNA-binding transcriptional repressor) of toxin-antitoxin stability system
MAAIHVDDLRERTDEVLCRLRETGEPVEIRDDGRTIAKLVPADEDLAGSRHAVRRSTADDVAAKDAEAAAIWTELERLSVEIGRRWPAGVSAAAAVRDDRRDL